MSAGTTIARYHVLRVIGRGAMGVVYEAYDPDLDRRVALKVLRFFELGDDAGQQRQARLLREAQALAQLSHPNVVTVLDVGRVAEQIFIAMELVTGDTVRAWLRAAPRSWREILDVFVAAGRGLAAAHAAGLVHRDIKPDNVMIGGDGRVRVMDFGLALVGDPGASMQAPIAVGWDPAESTLSGAVLTHEGRAAGTPAYMSPEQHRRRELDARSDQFSYCVALYEALHGTRPFRGDTAAMLAAAVCSDAPAPPPADSPVPSWVDAVVLRGLAKGPDARFPSMEALLAALGRDPSRRRRRWLAAGTLGLVAAAVWAVLALRRHAAEARCETAGVAIRDVWNDDAAERTRASLLATGIPHASIAWSRAEPHLRGYVDAWQTMRTDVCRRTEIERAWSSDLGERATECLDERRVRLQALLDVLGQADRDLVFGTVGAVTSLPELSACIDPASLARREPVASGAALRERNAALRDRLEHARAQSSSGRYDAARYLAASVLDDARKAGASRLELETMVTLGRVEAALDEHDRAQAHLEAAYFGAERSGAHEIAAEAAISLISVVGRVGAHPEDGLRWARHADGVLSRLESPHHLDRADLHSARGYLRSDLGEHDDAIADQRAALEIRREVLGNDHPEVAEALHGLSNAYFSAGRRVEAFTYLEEVLSIRERAFGDGHPAVAEVLNNLGVARTSTGDFRGARSALERALEIRRAALGQEHSRVANTLTALGDLAFEENEMRDAAALNRQALAIREKVLGPDHPNVAQSLNNLGAALNELGEYEEAVSVFRRAVQIVESAFGPKHLNTLLVRWGLGRAQIGAGDADRGRRTLVDALEVFSRDRSPDDVDVASYQVDYAEVMWSVASTSERSEILERARRASAILRDAGPDRAEDLRRLEAWLAAHAG